MLEQFTKEQILYYVALMRLVLAGQTFRRRYNFNDRDLQAFLLIIDCAEQRLTDLNLEIYKKEN